MKSMTCYGSAAIPTDFGQIDISLKSVNGRYLEVRTNIPPEYLKFEGEIKKSISRVFKRGTVTLFINRKKNPLYLKTNIVLKKNLAKKWHRALLELSKELKMASKPGLQEMMQIPDLFSVEEDMAVKDREEKLIYKILNQVIKECSQGRQREGQALQREILKYLESLENLLQGIAKQAQEQMIKLKKNLKIKTQSENGDLDQRLALDVTSQMDRADVSEEVVRLKEHLRAIKLLIQREDQVGKKLDFYTQELLREINTIGSKSQMFKMTQIVVDCKTIIEKIREQSQNVE